MAADLGGRGAAAYGGPRLAGRLTAELILRSPQYMNCVRQYELSLRGNKIAAIENLGVTENQFDAIDLTDNAIVRLEGFPRLHRLKCLLLHNNRVTRIAGGLEGSIPNLEVLMLANNRIANLQDLDPLASLSKLQYLCLSGNPVAMKPNYRAFVISKAKHLKVLDFRKVKQKERLAAEAMFSSAEAQATHAANTFDPAADLEAAEGAVTGAKGEQDEEGTDGQQEAAAAPTAEQITAIKAAIASASTLEEIQALEAALVTGQVPSGMEVDEQE